MLSRFSRLPQPAPVNAVAAWIKPRDEALHLVGVLASMAHIPAIAVTIVAVARL